jgi:integrase
LRSEIHLKLQFGGDTVKVPKAKRLPSGSWHIQLRLGGRSISVTEPTERACIKRAQLIKAEHLAGKDTRTMDRGVRTLDKLLETYIKAKRPVLSPSTVRGYEAIRRTRFLAYRDRDPEKINCQRMVSDESRLCGPKTLRNAWALVSAALAYSSQPVPAVTLPQLSGDEHPYLEAEQIPVFLDAVRDKPVELAALLGLHGLRRSEMCALTWADITLPPCHSERSEAEPKNPSPPRHSGRREESAPPSSRNVDPCPPQSLGTIRIHGALVHDAEGHLIRKPTNKNKTSRRIIPIMIPRLAELLSSCHSERSEESASSPVLTCHPNSIYKQINSACASAGLPLIGVHGLRHSFASLAHSLGLPEQETMALGGWEDPATMRKIYTHLDAAARLKASNAITAFFTSPAQPKNQTQNAHAKKSET